MPIWDDDDLTDFDVSGASKCKERLGNASTEITDESSSDSDMPAASSENSSTAFKEPNTKYLGRRLQMRFIIENAGRDEWFEGQIVSFEPTNGLYGVFFPEDGQTVFIDPEKEANDIIYYKT